MNNDNAMRSKDEVFMEMLRSADEFLEISKNRNTFIANFVNIALSCELYLKAIWYNKKENFKSGHDLSELFLETIGENESDFLKILCDEINCEFNTPPNDCGFVKICKDDYETIVLLKKMFKKHNKLFVDWRYIYEGKIDKPYNIDLTLIAFARALKRFVYAFVKQ